MRLERRVTAATLRLVIGLACAASCPAFAQAPPAPHDVSPPAPESAPPASKGLLRLSATLTTDGPPLTTGVVWRVFDERTQEDGSHALVAQSTEAAPTIPLADGRYLVHAAYGFASAMRHVVTVGKFASERVNLDAGGIAVRGMLGDAPIAPDKLSLSVFVPDHGNAEARLLVAGARPGQIIRLPEGPYHIVSTYLDTVGVGSLTPVSDTNSVVSADLRVQAGKLIEATVIHRAAILTLKLVNAPGGEALANTSFTILTPGGDIIRELIGAFPSLVLAEGDYLLIARHNGKTFQSEFKVQSALDRDIEVLAQ